MGFPGEKCESVSNMAVNTFISKWWQVKDRGVKLPSTVKKAVKQRVLYTKNKIRVVTVILNLTTASTSTYQLQFYRYKYLVQHLKLLQFLPSKFCRTCWVMNINVTYASLFVRCRKFIGTNHRQPLFLEKCLVWKKESIECRHWHILYPPLFLSLLILWTGLLENGGKRGN